DVSASVTAAQPDVVTFISQAVAAKGVDDAYAVVAAARNAAVVQSLSGISRSLGGELSAQSLSEGIPASDATDLAAGLRLAGNILPGSYRPRVVLLSDGQETSGDAVAQART